MTDIENTNGTLINKTLLQRVKKDEEERGNKFIVLCFDFPSEFHKLKDEQEKKNLANMRIEASNYIRVCSARLNNSVYIVHLGKIDNILNKIECVYAVSKWFKKVNVKIVGAIYPETVKEILITDITRLIEEIKNKLEEAEGSANYEYKPKREDHTIDFEKVSKIGNKIRSKIFAVNSKLRMIKHRITDLKEIDVESADKYIEEVRDIEKLKNEVLKQVR